MEQGTHRDFEADGDTESERKRVDRFGTVRCYKSAIERQFAAKH